MGSVHIVRMTHGAINRPRVRLHLLQIPKSAAVSPPQRSVVVLRGEAAVPLARTKAGHLQVLLREIHSLYLLHGRAIIVRGIFISTHEILTSLHLLAAMHLTVLVVLEGVAAVRKTPLVIPILFYALILVSWPAARSVRLQGVGVGLLGLVAAWAVHVPRLVYWSLRRHAFWHQCFGWLLIHRTLILCPHHYTDNI